MPIPDEADERADCVHRPWVQTMRSYVQQASAEQLFTEMGAGAADIAAGIRVKLPGLESPPALEPEQARFRLFDSITTFLKNASQSQPLMLVLDDLHWADRSSLLLLEFLARELGESRLLLVGCFRDTELSRQHPLAETSARLSREPVFRRQVLGGLEKAGGKSRKRLVLQRQFIWQGGFRDQFEPDNVLP